MQLYGCFKDLLQRRAINNLNFALKIGLFILYLRTAWKIDRAGQFTPLIKNGAVFRGQGFFFFGLQWGQVSGIREFDGGWFMRPLYKYCSVL
jgi:hypothetical protein